jgi:hypothetical protein
MHHGVRCLQLNKVSSFSWLSTGSVATTERRVRHVGIEVIPREPISPQPSSFSVLLASGEPVELARLSAAAFSEFERVPPEQTRPGSGEIRIHFQDSGLMLRDDTNGALHPLDGFMALVQYEVTETIVPFDLITYRDAGSASEIANAAVAQMNLVGLSGKLMIVYNEAEGGQVVFVPEHGDRT